MSRYLFLDSNYRNALAYGGRQIGSVFSEDVQRTASYCYDRAATVSQISYRMRLQPPGQRAAIIFGGNYMFMVHIVFLFFIFIFIFFCR
jgi:hypothetical protein